LFAVLLLKALALSIYCPKPGGFGGSGFQNGGICGDGFDSIGRASGIAGFGVRGRKNY
jgi:hypothetical protein